MQTEWNTAWLVARHTEVDVRLARHGHGLLTVADKRVVNRRLEEQGETPSALLLAAIVVSERRLRAIEEEAISNR